jgi:hypothetical protein
MILFCKGAPKSDRKNMWCGCRRCVQLSLGCVQITNETKETRPGQTKNTKLENPGTFEDNNVVSTFYFINIRLIMFYIIFINVGLITINTIISIYFDMEWNLQLSKSNS